MLICASCGRDHFRDLNDDPRDPPLDEGPCLCKECAEGAIEEVQDELQEQIEDLDNMKDRLK